MVLLVSSLASFIRRRKFGNGNGRFSDKVIKPAEEDRMLRLILNDFEANANGQSFLNYDAARKKIFLRILKPLADLTNLTEADFVDGVKLIIT
jgi:sulfite reductase (ferredoxin)